jgi:hypothetical protein
MVLLIAVLLWQTPDPVSEARIAWEKEHPHGHTKAEWEARQKALADATSEWIRQWPDNHLAWEFRREAILFAKSEEQWAKVGDGLLRTSGPEEMEDTKRLVAMDWIAAGVFLPKAMCWLREQWDKLEADSHTYSNDVDGDIKAASTTARRGVLVHELTACSIKMRDWKTAHWALERYRQWLDGDFRKHFDADPREFPDHDGRYAQFAGEVAEEENRLVDALAFYQQIVVNPWSLQEYGGRWHDKANAIWRKLGGTNEGWQVWSQLRDTGGLMTLPRGMPMQPWIAMNRPLPEMDVADANGRKWTLPDLRGKRVFVFLWATWCAPFWRHLGAVQKTYEALKGRPDALLLTVSLDEDPAAVPKFMKERGYSFPVLNGTEWHARLKSTHVMGETWYVDPDAHLRLVRVAVPYDEATWVGEALEKLGVRP